MKRSQRAAIVAPSAQASDDSVLDIHSLRRAAGLSQMELACRAQISRQRLSAAELGVVELSVSESLRVRTVLLREPNRRAAAIHKALHSAQEKTSEAGEDSLSTESLISATPTAAEAQADFTIHELAVALLREWQLMGVPLLGYDRTLVELEAAIEREVPGLASSPLKVAENIRRAQERYFQWLKKRTDEYFIYAHLFFREGLYRKRSRDWTAYLATRLRGTARPLKQTT